MVFAINVAVCVIYRYYVRPVLEFGCVIFPPWRSLNCVPRTYSRDLLARMRVWVSLNIYLFIQLPYVANNALRLEARIPTLKNAVSSFNGIYVDFNLG